MNKTMYTYFCPPPFIKDHPSNTTSNKFKKTLLAVAISSFVSSVSPSFLLAAEIHEDYLTAKDKDIFIEQPLDDYFLEYTNGFYPTSITSDNNHSILLKVNSLNISDKYDTFNIKNDALYGINSKGNSKVTIEVIKDISINSSKSPTFNLYGIYAEDSTVGLKSREGSVFINLTETRDSASNDVTDGSYVIYSKKDSSVSIDAKNNIQLTLSSDKNDEQLVGIASNDSNIHLDAGNTITISLKAENSDRGSNIIGVLAKNNTSNEKDIVELTQTQGTADQEAIYISAEGKTYNNVTAVKVENSDFIASAASGNITVRAINHDRGVAYAMWLNGTDQSKISTENGNILIASTISKDSSYVGNSMGAWLQKNATLHLKGSTIQFENSNSSQNSSGDAYSIRADNDSNFYIDEGSKSLNVDTYSELGTATAVYASSSLVDLKLSDSVSITSSDYGIRSANSGEVNVSANQIEMFAGYAKDYFYDGTAMYAQSNSSISLGAKNGINIGGIVKAAGSGSSIELSSNDGFNAVSAYGTRESYDSSNAPSALFASQGGEITMDAGAGMNYIQAEFNTATGDLRPDNIERAVWARSGGTINITGQTVIAASHAALDENGGIADEAHLASGLGVALAAGYVEEDLIGQEELPEPEEFSRITLKYEKASQLVGDVVSAYSGILNITPNAEGSNLTLYGNALAGNGGVLNVDLGTGGRWIGRADDYGDASLDSLDGNGHQEFFNPLFSHEIVQGGQVNVTMGSGSTWQLNGQSWVTELTTPDNAENVTVDLVSANTDRNEAAHALTIYNLKGNVNFNMSLDGDRDVSDMLYIKHAEGEMNINVVDGVSQEDMFRDGFDGLRFATVGKGSTASFRAFTVHEGVLDIEYEVETEAYDPTAKDENDAYNGSSLDSEKPGSDNVDDFFDYEENAGIATADVSAEEEAQGVDETTNYKLVGRKGETISEAGQTIFATARATYWNAVVLDRWNQRYGDRVYDQNRNGVWARVKHERLGTDAGMGDFRSYNTMYQFGYDYSKPTESGKMIWGGAIDYMDGRTDYKSIEGDGGTDRTELSLYATYLADNGFYGDLVVRAGRLSSDFQMYTAKGVKLDVYYDNWLYGLSFETGHQISNATGWFVEPQLQAQYIRITSGDYTTQQNTHVEQDDIDSLIGRAGFRVGKFISDDKATLGYFKADVLREFMGEQKIHVTDKTTRRGGQDFNLSNHGTWFDVGAGFQAAVTDDLYAYGDVEYRFGNDLERTWIFNVGAKYRF